MELKLTSEQWTDILHNNYKTRILDYDGWKSDKVYKEIELTAKEYIERLYVCTLMNAKDEIIDPIDLEILGENYINC